MNEWVIMFALREDQIWKDLLLRILNSKNKPNITGFTLHTNLSIYS